MSKLKKGSYLSRIVSQKDKLKWKYKILKQENKHLLELQKDMDKQYEELESVIYEIRKYINQLPYDDLKPIEVKVIKNILDKGDK